MNAIVAVDKNWGIGKHNDLLFHLPVDMKFFRQKSLGKVVAMGSNTLRSFPGGKPLKNRINVVLYPEGEKRADCTIVNSLQEMKDVLKQYRTEEVYIIGGAMFYHTMLEYCDTVYVTKEDADGDAEVFFDNLDAHPDWRLAEISDPVKDGEYKMVFCVYKNYSPRAL